MKKIIPLLLLLFCTQLGFAQLKELEDRISKITDNKRATVGVGLIIDGKDTVLINNDYHYPTQSIYKFHLALAVLNYLDKKNLPLDYKLHIRKKDLLPNTHSPIRDDYPEGNFNRSVADIIRYTVGKSDNNGCDILFRWLKAQPASIKSKLYCRPGRLSLTKREAHSETRKV